MDSYKKLIAVTFDATFIILCNYAIFNQNMEQKMISWILTMRAVAGDKDNIAHQHQKADQDKPQIAKETSLTNFSSFFLSVLQADRLEMEEDISSPPPTFTWSSLTDVTQGNEGTE